jgi:sugar lactone lactonase YvrE
MWLFFAGCRDPEPPAPGDDDDDTTVTATGHTGSEASTGSSGHTGAVGEHTAVGDPCASLVAAPLSVTAVRIETTEDFDFDAQARLIYADWNGNLVAVDDQARETLLSPGDWYSDARGIQVTSTGDILVNYISGGKIVKVDPNTGARVDFLTGLSGPNALEIGDGDVVYVTETGTGRVLKYDPVTEQGTMIASGFNYPNGLALSPDQLTLYVSDDSSGIFSIHRDPGSEVWSAPVLVFNPASYEAYDAMETDICGNLYSVQFYSGKLFRYEPANDTATLLVDLDDPQSLLWNAIRWGSNRGAWRRDTLYVTSRNKIFAVELGVDGRNQPVDLAP